MSPVQKIWPGNYEGTRFGRLTPYAGNYDYYLDKSKAANARAALDMIVRLVRLSGCDPRHLAIATRARLPVACTCCTDAASRHTSVKRSSRRSSSAAWPRPMHRSAWPMWTCSAPSPDCRPGWPRAFMATWPTWPHTA